MSEGPSNSPDSSMADAPMNHAHRKFADVRSIARVVGVLYSAVFFVEPIRRHSATVWIEFAVFYAAFLALYFLVVRLRGRRQAAAFGLFFLLGFAYYPLNRDAAGVFVYAFVVLCLFLERLSVLFLVLAAMMAGVAAETWYFGDTAVTAEEVLLFSVVLGLSNFAYAQQERANALLERANLQIARLTQEAERERIARDLHDLLGHTLTVIAVKLDLARRLLAGDADRARNEIVEAEQTARNALAEVRDAVSGYRAEGLDAEISRARRSLLSAGVKLATTLAPVTLAPNEAHVFCFVLREAVTNVVRHAAATVCRLTMLEKEGKLYFTIEDDGQGGPIREGNGLSGMRERLHAIGGNLKVFSSASQGTRLEITVPATHEAGWPREPQSARAGEPA